MAGSGSGAWGRGSGEGKGELMQLWVLRLVGVGACRMIQAQCEETREAAEVPPLAIGSAAWCLGVKVPMIKEASLLPYWYRPLLVDFLFP